MYEYQQNQSLTQLENNSIKDFNHSYSRDTPGDNQLLHHDTTEKNHQCVFTALIPELRKAIADSGYVTPTPIQAQAIPHLLAGRDLLGCAQTGTGKTAAFMLPILHSLAQNKRKSNPGHPRVLVLAPTRELAVQIGHSVTTYGRYLRAPHAVIYGGVSQLPQVSRLSRSLDIIIATPGRLLDLIQQGYINLNSIEVFVLDEADRMLDMGFIPDLRRIISRLPTNRQSLFFSATMSSEVISFAKTLVRDAVRISITPEQPAVERIEQKVYFVDKQSKGTLLTTLLGDSRLDKVIVFTRMKHAANKVTEKLRAAGVSAVAIHGNKSQGARTQALASFKSGEVRILVATDIAARGLDIDSISHVINYDLPNEPETYIHRIGRTARAGSEGIAFSFCTAEDRDFLSQIERLLGKPVPADTDHAYHCESASTAVGTSKRPGTKSRPKSGHWPARSPRRGLFSSHRS